MKKDFEIRENELRIDIAKIERHIETEDLSFTEYMKSLDSIVDLRKKLMDLYKEWEHFERIPE